MPGLSAPSFSCAGSRPVRRHFGGCGDFRKEEVPRGLGTAVSVDDRFCADSAVALVERQPEAAHADLDAGSVKLLARRLGGPGGDDCGAAPGQATEESRLVAGSDVDSVSPRLCGGRKVCPRLQVAGVKPGQEHRADLPP